MEAEFAERSFPILPVFGNFRPIHFDYASTRYELSSARKRREEIVEESGEYRVTRHKGREPDNNPEKVIYSHLEEAPANRFYNDTLPAVGTAIAMWRPDGSLVGFRSGPPR
jgi:hypothetical protein